MVKPNANQFINPTMIASLSKSLILNEKGIWISSITNEIKYPEDGNAVCFNLEDSSFWFRHRNDCIISVLRLFSPGGPILDIGGGNGFVTRRMLDEGFSAALLEPGEIGAMNAKIERNIPEVIQSTFEDANFPPESLSAVGLFDVLEHIENAQGFLKKIWTALTPNGLIYITVPAHDFLWSSSDNYAEHFRRYDYKMASVMIENYFTMKYFTYFNGVLMLPIFLFRTIPFRLHLAKQKSFLSTTNEHGTGGGIFVKLISGMLKKELHAIQRGKRLLWGTSVLLVLEKINNSNSQ